MIVGYVFASMIAGVTASSVAVSFGSTWVVLLSYALVSFIAMTVLAFVGSFVGYRKDQIQVKEIATAHYNLNDISYS
jgi:type IV secretory pathway VirB3-like protein